MFCLSNNLIISQKRASCVCTALFHVFSVIKGKQSLCDPTMYKQQFRKILILERGRAQQAWAIAMNMREDDRSVVIYLWVSMCEKRGTRTGRGKTNLIDCGCFPHTESCLLLHWLNSRGHVPQHDTSPLHFHHVVLWLAHRMCRVWACMSRHIILKSAPFLYAFTMLWLYQPIGNRQPVVDQQ